MIALVADRKGCQPRERLTYVQFTTGLRGALRLGRYVVVSVTESFSLSAHQARFDFIQGASPARFFSGRETRVLISMSDASNCDTRFDQARFKEAEHFVSYRTMVCKIAIPTTMMKLAAGFGSQIPAN
jgi:hypothetical protein